MQKMRVLVTSIGTRLSVYGSTGDYFIGMAVSLTLITLAMIIIE